MLNVLQLIKRFWIQGLNMKFTKSAISSRIENSSWDVVVDSNPWASQWMQPAANQIAVRDTWLSLACITPEMVPKNS